jgi:hypothetical protein
VNNVNKTKTTIKINGKHYDATTGKLVGISESESVPHAPATSLQTVRSASGQVIDGVTRRAAPTGSHARRAPERSKTLMRTTVQKPSAQHTETSIHAHGGSTHGASANSHHHQPLQGSLHARDNLRRMRHAQSISKSHLISKFTVEVPRVDKQSATLPVRPEPAASRPPTPHISPSSAARSQDGRDLIVHALERATAHKQPAQHHHTPAQHRSGGRLNLGKRGLSMAASGLALLLLVGFFGYQNAPNISMRVAAKRAGFAAELPGYKPSGFSTGRISYDQGRVTVNFTSNSDNRSYIVDQQPSSLNSQALLESVVSDNGQNYRIYQQLGKTIYIYGESEATWVNGGIWYQIEGDSSLTGDQLLKIAASM